MIPAVIPAIILAAGKSTRMGRAKALLSLGHGETFLTHLLATFRAAGIDDVVVVVGHEAGAIVDVLQRGGETARIVVNEDYESGQLSSLLAGLRLVDRPGLAAALVTLVDVPLVAVSTVRAVVDRYRSTHAPVVRPVRGGRHGHPVLIDRALFDELRASDPSQGARAVVRAHASAAGDVDVDDDGAFTDVDTAAEYEALTAQLARANQDLSREPRADSSTRSWDAIADEWVAHADTNDYRNLFLLPLTFRLLGDVRGKRVLDLGCGESGYARELARRGARVTGVDGSERLVEIAQARTRAEGLDVDYVCANASALDSVPSASFDLVLASMSLMDVEDYDGSVREAHRVLTKGGELLMSITHPCFSAPVSEWVGGEAGHPRSFAVDRYFERTAWESLIARAFRTPVVRRHRPLEDYMASLLGLGFVLRDFLEPTATDEDVKKSARFEHLTRIPYFLFMRWQKP